MKKLFGGDRRERINYGAIPLDPNNTDESGIDSRLKNEFQEGSKESVREELKQRCNSLSSDQLELLFEIANCNKRGLPFDEIEKWEEKGSDNSFVAQTINFLLEQELIEVFNENSECSSENITDCYRIKQEYSELIFGIRDVELPLRKEYL